MKLKLTETQTTESQNDIKRPIPPGVRKSKFGLLVSAILFASWLCYLGYMAIRLGQ